jgi:hypothetical protein
VGRSKKHQADQRADLRGGKFIGLPTVVFTSEAWRLGLNSFDRDVHLQILAKFSGYNNGQIAISQREIADAIGNSNFRKIGRSIARQIEVGLLGIATEGLWKQRKAREYRLTYITANKPPFTTAATNDYLHWRKNDADDVSARNAQKPQKRVNKANPSADDVSSLISKPYQGTQKTEGETGSKYGRPILDAVPNCFPTEEAA